MPIKILSSGEITTAKRNAIIQEFENLQDELLVEIKNALDHMVEIDYLYAVRNHIDDLLAYWQDKEIELEEEDEDE